MTPGARATAAIEILERTNARPADRVIDGYFRRRRYAGAKDRAAISAQVFGVLRRRAGLAWQIGLAAGDPEPTGEARARDLVLADVALAGSADAIAEQFSGQGYAPPPPDTGERAWLAALVSLPPGAVPDWVAGNYPPWLDGTLRERFGAALNPELAALNIRAPLDLRVNRLKAQRADVLAALAGSGIEAAPSQFARDGIRLENPVRLDRHKVLTTGLAEPQDEGSQLAALLCEAAPSHQVIDLCAGGGGKTLALAAQMENRGQIFACDPEARRLKKFVLRRDRAGVRNVQTRDLGDGGEAWLATKAGAADRVLVDAPCSGTGVWRRDPGIAWRLNEAALKTHTARQARLLDTGAALVRPGGRLIYVTCSLLRCENEERAEAFLAGHPAFSLVPVANVWQAVLDSPVPLAGDMLMMTPHRTGTDGVFVATFERRDSEPPQLDDATGAR